MDYEERHIQDKTSQFGSGNFGYTFDMDKQLEEMHKTKQLQEVICRLCYDAVTAETSPCILEVSINGDREAYVQVWLILHLHLLCDTFRCHSVACRRQTSWRRRRLVAGRCHSLSSRYLYIRRSSTERSIHTTSGGWVRGISKMGSDQLATILPVICWPVTASKDASFIHDFIGRRLPGEGG